MEMNLFKPYGGFRGQWLGERGLRLETGDATLAIYTALAACPPAEIEDVIPADGTLLIVLRRGVALPPQLVALLAALPQEPLSGEGKLHEVKVEYGGEAGPDLLELASRSGMTPRDYIECHASAQYVVAFLGFQPGFPYLRGTPTALHAPRRATPRVRVNAGSVGIGGTYSGVYPAEGPGGWNIIGRSQETWFDPFRSSPALVQPGDRVRFVPT